MDTRLRGHDKFVARRNLAHIPSPCYQRLMKRYDHIQELLKDVEEKISALETQKSSALADDNILQLSNPKVKNALENLRSCLDYIAKDISQEILKSKKKKGIYFPRGRDRKDFQNNVNKYLPGLKGNLLQEIENIQPYINADGWLEKLCHLCNQYKHDSLPEQQRENSTFINIGNGAIILKDCDGGHLLGNFILGEKAERNLSINLNKRQSINDIQKQINPNIPLEIYHENVSFKEKSHNTDLLELIRKSYTGISSLTESVKEVITTIS